MASVLGVGPATIDRTVLPNGVTLLVYPNPVSPSVAVVGHHAGCALFEDESTCGLANLTAGALSRGTATRTFLQFSTELDAVGASLSFDAGVESADLHGRGLAEDLELLVRLSADALRNPTFPAEEVTRLRDQALASIAQVEDSPRALSGRRFHEMLYGRANPYGRPDDGYAASVSNLAASQLHAFHAITYSPAVLTLAVVGDVRGEEVRDLVARYLGDWRSPPAGPSRERWRQAIATYDRSLRDGADQPLREDLTLAGKTQTELVLGWNGVRRHDAAYYATVVGNFILGQLGMGGRIGANVRDRQGMAYHAASYVETGHARHPWAVRAGVNPANVPRAVATIHDELQRFCTAPPDAEELRLTKQALIGSLPLRLERNDGIADVLLTIEEYDLGLDYLQRFPDLINAVSGADVQAAATAVLSNPGYTLVTAGPALPAPAVMP
ncbi:MAG: insulinase family protein [Actinobacteria bacterium]|nr:insulinase family protein [Actinomycetota bacterium]